MRFGYSIAGVFAVLALSCTQGQPNPPSGATETHGHVAAAANTAAHAVVRPDEVKWSDAPPSLPAGAKTAVLEGDPSREGFFVMRAMLPANYRIAPHWHPTTERITVLSGTMYLGMGERFDPAAGQALPAGTYATMPAGMRHFAYTKGEAVIQIGTMGPWEITYVNAADDPRQQKR